MVEHRLPATFNYDGDPWLQGSFSLPDQGLALWYVKTDPTGQLLIVPNIAGGTNNDRSLYIVPAGGGTPGSGRLWDRDDGAARPLWLDLDGTAGGSASGLALRVSSDVSRPEITFRIGNVATCDPLPPVSGPPPATVMPEADGGPCSLVRNAAVCTLRTPSFVATRRIPRAIAPGKTFSVQWVVTPRTGGRLQLIDALPKGFRALGKLRPVVLSKGRKVTRTYRVHAADSLGRYRLPAVALFTPKGKKKARRTALQAVAIVFSTSAIKSHPFRPEPPPPPPPPLPDLVVAAVSANGALVRNEGSVAAGAFVVRFIGVATRDASVNGLAPGASLFVAIPGGVCSKPRAPLTAIADADGSVREVNEGNNSRQGTC